MKTKTLLRVVAMLLMSVASMSVFAQLTELPLSNPRAGAAHYVNSGETYTDSTTHHRSQFISMINDPFDYNPNDLSNANTVINQGITPNGEDYTGKMYFCKDARVVYGSDYYSNVDFLSSEYGDSAYQDGDWASVDFTIPKGKVLSKMHFWGRNNKDQFGNYYRMGVMLEDTETGLRQSTTELSPQGNPYFKFCDGDGRANDPDGLQYFETVSFTDVEDSANYSSNKLNLYFGDDLIYNADRLFVHYANGQQVGLMVVEMRLAVEDAPFYEIAKLKNVLPSMADTTISGTNSFDLDALLSSVVVDPTFIDAWGCDTLGTVVWDKGGYTREETGTYTVKATVKLPEGTTDNDGSVGALEFSFDVIVEEGVFDPYTYAIDEKAVAYWNFENVGDTLGAEWKSQMGDVTTSWNAYGSESPAYMTEANDKEVYHHFGKNANFDFSSAHMITASDPLADTENGSISMWMCRRDNDNQYRGWISHDKSSDNYWAISTNGDTKVDFRIGGKNNYYADTTLTKDKWFHIVTTYEKTIDTNMVASVIYEFDTTYLSNVEVPDSMVLDTLSTVNDTTYRVDTVSYGKVYINGTLQNYVIGKTDRSKRPKLYNGGRNAEVVWKFGEDRDTKRRPRGFMDEVAMFNKALTPEQIKALYDAGVAGQPYRAIYLSGVKVSQDTASIEVGYSKSLSYALLPMGATSEDGVTWSTSDSSIAVVDQSGNVQAISKGEVMITVTSNENSEFKDVCTVTITNSDPYTYVIDEKPIAYWNFENVTETMGEDWTSQIGNVKTSWTAYGDETPAYTTEANDKEIYHAFGKNANFDFSSAHMITASDPLADTENGSISMWMCRRDNDSQYRGWISHDKSSDNYWAISTNGDTKVDFRIGGKNNYYADTTLTKDKWFHIVTTYEKAIDTNMVASVIYEFDTTYLSNVEVPDSMVLDTLSAVNDTTYRVDTVSYGKVYINGTLQNYVIGKTDRSKRPKLYNGGRNAEVVWKFGEDRTTKRRPRGFMDEIAMFDKALTPEQVKAIYDGGMKGMPIRTIPVEDASLTEESIALKKGQEAQLEYALVPTMAEAFKGFAWTSTDESVVTVDKMGKVTAVGGGMAKVVMAYKGDMTITDTCEFTVSALETVTLNKQSADLKKGEDVTLSYTYAPSDFELDSVFVYTTSNEEVATVDQDGKVVALGGGEALIIVSYDDPVYDIKDTCVVTVKDLESVTVSKDSLVFEPGEFDVLEFTYAPLGVELDSVFVWSSSDDKVATVDQTGLVMAMGLGTADILIAYTADGIDVKDTCKVVVVGPESVAINVDSLVLDVDSMATLSYSYMPEGLQLKSNFVWTSSDDKVVTIDQDGNVKAIAAGMADIIVSYNNFSLSVADTCKVVVNEANAISNALANTLEVYPNPANNIVVIDGLKATTMVSVYNLAGMKVLEQLVNANDKQLNISSLTAGMYLIDVDGATVKLQVK